VKVIARIVCRQNVLGINGIPGDGIKIDDAIKGAAFPDPRIDCEVVPIGWTEIRAC